jgi:murein L,D-transpeptidase YafK
MRVITKTIMKARLVRAGLLVAALALAGCTESLEDISRKAEKPLPQKLVIAMKAKGMTRTSPIMVRIFKEEGVLEVWKQKDTGRYDLVTSYDICKWSGKLGPKFTEGDRQAPEGFYTVRPLQMNPNSNYHLAFNIGYPNTYDRANGRTGQHLMVHGACSSAGCYSMSDNSVEEIYAFARDAFRGGQTEFQIQAFPFRMTAANMARYKDDPNFPFWRMLKEGYDHFEITKVPPKVDVCEKRYVFNQIPEGDRGFSPTSACPVATQPDALKMAYATYSSGYEAAFSAATNGDGNKRAPAPTIAGLKEAYLVADWSKRRARGERVSRQPPSLTPLASPMEAGEVGVASLPQSAPVPASTPAMGQKAGVAAAYAEEDAVGTAANPAPAEPAKRRRLWRLFGG